MSISLLLLASLFACNGNTDDGGGTPDEGPLEIPPGVSEIDGVWDAQNQRMVMFGGNSAPPEGCVPKTNFESTTWEFVPETGRFHLIDTDDAPKKRGRYARTLDETRNRMIIHGGRNRVAAAGPYKNFDDLWAFDLSTDTWSKLKGKNGPSARTNHTMVAAGDDLYLFGGNTSTDGAAFNPLNDLWHLDLKTDTWTSIAKSGEWPSPRLFHAAATDGDTMYIYGGGDANAFFGPFFEELWALDLNTLTWELIDAGSTEQPNDRFWPNIGVDKDNDRLLMFGGHDMGEISSAGEMGNANDLWEFDLVTREWTMLRFGDKSDNTADVGACEFPPDFTKPDVKSPDRRSAAASTVTDDGRMLIFGGKTDCGNINDAWSLDFSTDKWTSLSIATEGEACLRAYQDCTTLCF